MLTSDNYKFCDCDFKNKIYIFFLIYFEFFRKLTLKVLVKEIIYRIIYLL